MASKPGSPKSPKSPKDGGGKVKALDINELMQRLDEAVAKTIEDTQQLFIINVAEQRLVLTDSRDCIEKLARENAELVDNFKRQEQENFTFQALQTEDIFQKRSQIESLQAQLVQKNHDIEKIHVDYKADMRKINDEKRLKRRHLVVTSAARVEALQQRLDSVKAFVDRQDEVEQRMEAAEKETEETRQRMADLEPDYERKFIDSSRKNKEEHDKKLEDFMQKVKAEIQERIGDRVREVLAQNEVLLSEIHMHTSETSGLQAETNRLTAENTKLRREIDLVRQAGELHVKRSRHQRHVIRHSDSKMADPESRKSLQQVIRQFSEERRILQAQHNYVVAEVQFDNQKLKSIVLQKAQELKKFRHLAQIVIRQRGEVELFLLDSIQYVKNQIYLQKRIQSYQTVDADIASKASNSSINSGDHTLASTLPVINTKAPASWPGTGPWPRFKESEHGQTEGRNNNGAYMSDREAESQINFLDSSRDPFTIPQIVPMIDISKLSWQDREKVLRYLFKKINTARNRTLEAEPQSFRGYKSDSGRTIV